jgi:selenocysteine-specific elongation factor
VCLPAFAPALSAQDERILADLLAELETAGFHPPSPGQLRAAKLADARRLERLLKIAVAHGALVRIDGDIYLAAPVEERLRDTVRRMVESGEEVTVAAVREKLESSRKYVVPFLEHLDRAGFTRRVGDARVLAETEAKAKV